MAKAKKFYAVCAGYVRGVFEDWPSVQQATAGYLGARFKGYVTLEAAEKGLQAGCKGEWTIPSRSPSRFRGFADVQIYCDGTRGESGEAGSGVVVYRDGQEPQLLHGCYLPRGTNNIAELNALYEALRIAEQEVQSGKTVKVLSDSMYAVTAVTEWARGWKRRGWRKSDGGAIENLEIIQRTHALYMKLRASVRIEHIAGHSGVEGNELADKLAKQAVYGKVVDLRPYNGRPLRMGY